VTVICRYFERILQSKSKSKFLSNFCYFLYLFLLFMLETCANDTVLQFLIFCLSIVDYNWESRMSKEILVHRSEEQIWDCNFALRAWLRLPWTNEYYFSVPLLKIETYIIMEKRCGLAAVLCSGIEVCFVTWCQMSATFAACCLNKLCLVIFSQNYLNNMTRHKFGWLLTDMNDYASKYRIDLWLLRNVKIGFMYSFLEILFL